MEENYWDRFADLTLRSESSLTPDERASLEYFLAADDELLHSSCRGPARRWARMARIVLNLSLRHGRLLREGDEHAYPDALAWIASQHPDDLNAYQRACLEAIPGWTYPSAPGVTGNLDN
jgi:hypothetical protein